MTWQTARSAIGALTLFPGVLAAASDAFVVPRLEAQAGYEHNRLNLSSQGEGSPFWQAGPGLDVIALGLKTETALLLDYRRRQYSGSDSESTDDVSAFVRWRHFEAQNEAGATLGGGLYRDAAWPSDDCTFWQARPYIVRTLTTWPAELSLKGAFGQTFYDVSVYTSAADRADSRADVRPGLRWHLPRRVTVWAELYAEYNESDASEADYSGFGGAMGCEFQPTARLNVGVWAGTGTRPYAQSVDGESRCDTPTPAGAWATYRLRPWLELFSSVDGESHASTIADSDYSWWRLSAGMRLVVEHELRRSQ